MKVTLFIIALFSLGACGDSPLWNHKIEAGLKAGEFFKLEAEVYELTKTGHQFSLNWKKGPGLGESKFILRTWNKDIGTQAGPYENFPSELNLYLWMPDMGHGSADVKINQLAPGEYEITNVFFVMKGAWEIHVEMVNGQEVLDEVIIPITL